MTEPRWTKAKDDPGFVTRKEWVLLVEHALSYMGFGTGHGQAAARAVLEERDAGEQFHLCKCGHSRKTHWDDESRDCSAVGCRCGKYDRSKPPAPKPESAGVTAEELIQWTVDYMQRQDHKHPCESCVGNLTRALALIREQRERVSIAASDIRKCAIQWESKTLLAIANQLDFR